MTRKGEHPMSPTLLRLFARLVQIHHMTDPERIARRHNVSPEYVRRQWRNVPYAQMTDLADKLERLLADG